MVPGRPLYDWWLKVQPGAVSQTDILRDMAYG